jgi:hypothetical protein
MVTKNSFLKLSENRTSRGVGATVRRLPGHGAQSENCFTRNFYPRFLFFVGFCLSFLFALVVG